MHNQPREPQLMSIVKQNRFKSLGKLHKEWTEAGVKVSRATTYRHVKEFGYSCRQRRLTWAKEKKNWTVAQWSKVGVDRYVFFRAETDYYRSSRPITDILNRYTCLV